MSGKISKERKLMYYLGGGLMVLGFLLFFSSFFTQETPDPFDTGMPAFFVRALVGMGLVVAGGVVRGIGAGGAAGSGLVLDPERAREDLKPYTQAGGKMVSDLLENVDALKSREGKEPSVKEVVKVRCRNCQALNEEDAKFCKSCGAMM